MPLASLARTATARSGAVASDTPEREAEPGLISCRRPVQR